MISATQLRPGMVVKWNNELYSIFKMEHRTPGNLRGFVQVKMRNLSSGSMMEHRFSSEDKVERAALEQQVGQRNRVAGADRIHANGIAAIVQGHNRRQIIHQQYPVL